MQDFPLKQGHEVRVMKTKLQHVVSDVGQCQNISIIQVVYQQLADFLVQLRERKKLTHPSLKFVPS